MDTKLLDKIRSINALLGNFHLHDDFLENVCTQLGILVLSNIYLYDNTGNIVCYSTHDNYHCEYNSNFLTSYSMPNKYMEITKTLSNPISNIYESEPQCTCPGIDYCIYNNRYTSIVPIFYSHEKIGAILLIKYDEPFNQEDQIVCEHAFAIISLELARKEIEEIKTNSLYIASADIAFNSLSYSEIEACKVIFEKINFDQGIIIASEISSKLFLTRSIINNALNKLGSAGIIVVSSLGVKGTHIKVLNKKIFKHFKNNPNN